MQEENWFYFWVNSWVPVSGASSSQWISCAELWSASVVNHSIALGLPTVAQQNFNELSELSWEGPAVITKHHGCTQEDGCSKGFGIKTGCKTRLKDFSLTKMMKHKKKHTKKRSRHDHEGLLLWLTETKKASFTQMTFYTKKRKGCTWDKYVLY